MKVVLYIGFVLCINPALQAQNGGHQRRWGAGNSTINNIPVAVQAPPPAPPPIEIPVYQPVIGPVAPILDLDQHPQTPIAVERSAVIPYDATLPHEVNVIRNIDPNPIWDSMSINTNSEVVAMAKEALRDARVQAFLDIIARAEVADQLRRDDAYKILHGFGMLKEYTRLHPGIRSKGATAAGRYQFTQKTYNPLYHRYSTAGLSFHPPGQDLAAVLLLHERGILRFIAMNDVVGGVKHGAKTWAGLPYYEDGDRTGNRSFYRGVHKNRSTFGFEVAEQHYINRLTIYQGSVPNVYVPPTVNAPIIQAPVVVNPPDSTLPVHQAPTVVITAPAVVSPTPPPASIAPASSWRIRRQ